MYTKKSNHKCGSGAATQWGHPTQNLILEHG